MHKGSVIVANVALKNCYFGNIYADNDVDHILTTKDDKENLPKGAQIQNVVLENIFYNNQNNERATAFDLDVSDEHKDYKVEKLIINRAFLGNCKSIFYTACDCEIQYRDLFGSYVENANGTIQG
jgi:hypothetical protein